MRFNALVLLPVAVSGAVIGNAPLSESEVLDALKPMRYLMDRPSFKAAVERRAITSESASTPPKSEVPEVQVEPAKYGPAGTIRKKIRYGPYRLPSTTEKNVESVMMGVNGMTDAFGMAVKKPCAGDCLLMGIESGLEYADGKTANTDTGSWLHHVVLINAGPKVSDIMCGAGKGEALFMDGNERTPNIFFRQGVDIKSGYPLHKEDTFVYTVELMNMDPKEKWVWLTMSFEYLDGANHPEYRPVHQLFLSIGPSCSGFVNPAGASNLTMTGQPKSKVFSERSIPWVSRVDGDILGTGGHLHDGGTTLEVWHNDKLICDSRATYGGEGFTQGEGMAGMAVGGDPMEHISSMKTCENLGPIKKKDTITLNAKYDFTQHKGMLNKKGDLDEVMGIAGVLIAV